MASIRKTNAKASVSPAAVSAGSQPLKAGETTPSNIVPKITFADSMSAAASKIDALLRGGVDCVTYIASALLVGYLANAGAKVKLSVMRDEFSLALGKKGLGGTQTKKYLDYGSKMAGNMFKECAYGMEMAALLAADNPDKAHDAVVAWLSRHTKGKKTEHGYKLDDAAVKLNSLGIYLGFEGDPNKPEQLMETDVAKAERETKARKAKAEQIEKDPSILSHVTASKLVDTLATVITFDVLVSKHVNAMTVVDDITKELAAIEKAYKARIKELKANLGQRAAAPIVSSEAAAA